MPASNEHGFTLLEAVVAVLIMGLIGATALEGLSAELRTAERARAALNATALAQYRLASLHLLDHETLILVPDSLRQGVFEPPFEAYRWDADVEPSDEADGLFDLHVNVSWEAGSFQLQTRVYRPGPQVGRWWP